MYQNFKEIITWVKINLPLSFYKYLLIKKLIEITVNTLKFKKMYIIQYNF